MLRDGYNQITFLLRFESLVIKCLILFFVDQNAFLIPHSPDAGLVAIFALIINAVILLGCMSMFKFVLTLPGIGSVTAQAIIDARAVHPFLYPEDLKAVPGIGDKTLEKIRNLIRVP